MPKAALTRVAINYIQRGSWTPSCVPLVLIHGLAASSAFWLRVSEQLSNVLPVLLYDLRGHGRSGMPPEGYSPAEMAADLIEFLSFLHIDAATLAGHSFGGSVALHTALQWTGRVESVVLADTRLRLFQPQMTPASWPKWEQRKHELHQLGIQLADDEPEGGYRLLTEVARLQFRGESGGEDLPRWVAELCGQAQSRFTATRWLELVERTPALAQFSAGDQITARNLRMLSARLLAIYGEHSPALPTAQALQMERPDTDLRIVPKAGHFFPLTKPEAFTAPVLQFLSRAEPAHHVQTVTHRCA
jgi:pimeloyl-ACP methyl ester carboxylesterase